MKKFLLMIVMAAIIVPAFVSCKKGPDDPTISFKSRNARITAKWKLSTIAGTHKYVGSWNNSIYTETITYNGSLYSQITTAQGGTGGQTETGTGTFEMTIDKDGVFSFTENFIPTGGTSIVVTGSGNWYWLGNDNSKVAISFSTGGAVLFKEGAYNIDELKTKEIILKQSSSTTDNGHVTSDDYTYTFEKE